MDLRKVEVRLGSDEYLKPLPQMCRVQQKFNIKTLENISSRIRSNTTLFDGLSGKRIAVTVGSRGISRFVEILKTVVDMLKDKGASVIIIPAMGSHGGATAEGQIEVLTSYGINEEEVGAPIISSMDVVNIGKTRSGQDVFIDKVAFEADGIVVMNKNKPHADFKGNYESGLVKMMAIGLGKHRGAVAVHKKGFGEMARLLPEFAEVILKSTPVLCGIAILENERDELYDIEIVPPDQILEREKELLTLAKLLVPRIPVRNIDVLIVEEIGKNISGEGMDPNVTGRPGSGLNEGFVSPAIDKIVVFRVTPESHGNGVGLGMADISTVECAESLDLSPMYVNVLTTGALNPAKIPLLAKTEESAIRLAMASSTKLNWEKCKIVWIKNTLELEELYVSTALIEECKESRSIIVNPECYTFKFDQTGHFIGFTQI
jgi:hypothetical protein